MPNILPFPTGDSLEGVSTKAPTGVNVDVVCANCRGVFVTSVSEEELLRGALKVHLPFPAACPNCGVMRKKFRLLEDDWIDE